MSATDTAELACRQVVELVTDYLEGTLPESERLAFDAHLALCDGCTTYLAQVRTMLAALPEACDESSPPAARDELLRLFGDWLRDQP
jgi:anti-sigma factor RsiW